MPIGSMYGFFPTMSQPLTAPQNIWTIPERAPGAINTGEGMATGSLSALAQQMAGNQAMRPGPGSYFPGTTSGVLDLEGQAANMEAQKKNKLKGTASGAAAGAQVAGPWGALVGGALGYIGSGGMKDTNPISAAGFTGKTMDEARREGDLARQLSNPTAAIASSLGVKSDSFAGKLLDPAGAFSQSRYETPYWESILANPDIASVASPEDLTTGFVGMFRGGRNTFPGRQKYGAKDDEQFLADMAGKINQAYSAGSITGTSSAQDVFDKAVNPWLESMGKWSDNPADWEKAEKAATVALINNYITGGPLTWSQAHGQEAKVPVPEYAGLQSQPGGPSGVPGLSFTGGPLSQLAYGLSRRG